jgi:hypothetical protein
VLWIRIRNFLLQRIRIQDKFRFDIRNKMERRILIFFLNLFVLIVQFTCWCVPACLKVLGLEFRSQLCPCTVRSIVFRIRDILVRIGSVPTFVIVIQLQDAN